MQLPLLEEGGARLLTSVPHKPWPCLGHVLCTSHTNPKPWPCLGHVLCTSHTNPRTLNPGPALTTSRARPCATAAGWQLAASQPVSVMF